MSSTEDDTFKRLKSLTREEAEKIQSRIFLEIATEQGRVNSEGHAEVSLGIFRERVDRELLPYGWSLDRLFQIDRLEDLKSIG